MRPAFTLIETLVVMTITGLLASLLCCVFFVVLCRAREAENAVSAREQQLQLYMDHPDWPVPWKPAGGW